MALEFFNPKVMTIHSYNPMQPGHLKADFAISYIAMNI
jgi:hypothetical protein